MPAYRIQLEDTYAGPMDLLLYLIRRDEIDIYDIPISRVLQDYLKYVRLMESLDPDAVGEFLVIAATLMEIKSRLLLPKPPIETDEEDDELDPRADLVRQLLAYRAYREAAGSLSGRAETHSRRFTRPGQDIPQDENREFDIEDAQIWDLMTAFNKLLASTGHGPIQHEVLYDDTPITLHAADLLDRLDRDGPSMFFEQIFEGRTRGEMIGLFLALLELIRQDRVRVEQPDNLGRISIHLIDATPITTVMENESQGFKRGAIEESDEDAEPDFVEVINADEAAARAEAEYMEELLDADEGDDEFSRQIEAVEIADIDLGRTTTNEKTDQHLDEDEET